MQDEEQQLQQDLQLHQPAYSTSNATNSFSSSSSSSSSSSDSLDIAEEYEDHTDIPDDQLVNEHDDTGDDDEFSDRRWRQVELNAVSDKWQARLQQLQQDLLQQQGNSTSKAGYGECVHWSQFQHCHASHQA